MKYSPVFSLFVHIILFPACVFLGCVLFYFALNYIFPGRDPVLHCLLAFVSWVIATISVWWSNRHHILVIIESLFWYR